MKPLFLFLIFALAATVASPATNPWPQSSRESRPWTYWWWMGSAVDPPNITRELERYHAAGFGGVHIIPIYGAQGYEDRYVQYLSPEWMSLLRYTVAEAGRLDMGVDMTLGTGWCFGGPHIAGNDACAVVVSKSVEVQAGGVLADPFSAAATQAVAAFGPGSAVLDLGSKLQADQSLSWAPSDGPWKVIFVSQQQCKTPVKRAAPGGEGPMLNPFYRPAIDHYLVRFADAFRNYSGARPRALYQDSFEYEVNWSPEFFQQFEKLRGYRLQDHMDALFSSAGGDRAARVKSDYRETAADLLLDDFTRPWIAWTHQQGFIARNQAHGSPGNWLDLYAAADIPETEMFRDDRSILVSKFSSSAAHVAGRRLSSSESGTWLKEHFHERLADLKILLDELFLSGVNHIFFHGTAYSPDEAPWPGWLFYASTQMNPRNSIWRDVPALSAYITRTESVLQSAKPDNDILLYWPIYDYWHSSAGLGMNFTIRSLAGTIRGTAFGNLARNLWNHGFAFDYISDRQVSAARARSGSIEVPGGSYRTLVIPATEHMPVATARNLLELARHGATIIFEAVPRDVPGWKDFTARQLRLHELFAPLPFRKFSGFQVARLGSGKVMAGEVESALASAGIDPEPMVKAADLHFVRLESGGVRSYFIVNSGAAIDKWVPLPSLKSSVMLMDPATGNFGRGAVRRSARAREVYLQLAPNHSLILQLNHNVPGTTPAWKYRAATGPAMALTGSWAVEFVSGGPELPPSARLTALRSWTELGEAAERFAGTARYTLLFDAPTRSSNQRWEMDLGDVRESARVRCNGTELGTLLLAPFRVLLPPLKPSGNRLEIEVTNLSANRIGDLDRRGIPWRKFHDINFVNLDYQKFDASEWPIMPSGLLGPLTIRPTRSFSLALDQAVAP